MYSYICRRRRKLARWRRFETRCGGCAISMRSLRAFWRSSSASVRRRSTAATYGTRAPRPTGSMHRYAPAICLRPISGGPSARLAASRVPLSCSSMPNGTFEYEYCGLLHYYWSASLLQYSTSLVASRRRTQSTWSPHWWSAWRARDLCPTAAFRTASRLTFCPSMSAPRQPLLTSTTGTLTEHTQSPHIWTVRRCLTSLT